MDRISKPDYIPTTQDILHARKATKGIAEYTIKIEKVPFRFVDVGGQRSQRQKWFQCFDSVTSILFFVSTSEFDQVLLEDRRTNRLIESLNIFDTIINNRVFIEVSMILFLNKMDLLKEKLEKSKLKVLSPESIQEPNGSPFKIESIANKPPSIFKDYFPEFEGDCTSLPDVQEFIRKKFEGVTLGERRRLYPHFTTAIDTDNIKYVFNDVKSTILNRNITSLMLQ